MVDLVKIRRKAKAKKDEAEAVSKEETLARTEAAPAAQTPAELPASGRNPPGGEAPADAGSAAPAGEPEEREKPEEGKDAKRRRSKLEQFRETAGIHVEEIVATDTGATGAEALRELLTFEMAGESYAVGIEKIIEIITPRRVTRIPNSGELVVGIVSLRGTIVTVVDARRRLGHQPQPEVSADGDERLIVVESEGETAGFVVDKVSRVVKLDPSAIQSHPVVSSDEQSEYVAGVFQYGKKLMILLDMERLLAY
jgi:purine-binding chemotaxis protein CheW